MRCVLLAAVINFMILFHVVGVVCCMKCVVN